MKEQGVRNWAEKLAAISSCCSRTDITTCEICAAKFAHELAEFRKEVLRGAAGKFRKQPSEIRNWAARWLEDMAEGKEE